MRLIGLIFAVTLLSFAGDTGVPPRARTTDYPASQATRGATLAATVVPVKQISRMFSAEISRQYIVLEVAVYPQNNQIFDVDSFDFGLKMGDTVAYAEKPSDVATPWREKNTTVDKPVTVISETGVVYSKGSDPVYGRRSGWSVYEGIAVTNDPRAAAPPPAPQMDPQIIEQRVRETMLPEGPTSTAIAGYLFFPQYKLKGRKGNTMELQWFKDNASAVLRLPNK